jgi:hypothetical protein
MCERSVKTGHYLGVKAAPVGPITAGRVHVDEKIDQPSKVSITCRNITIGQKIDQHCNVTITAANLLIGQGISQHCIVRYHATGKVQLGTIDDNCDVKAF